MKKEEAISVLKVLASFQGVMEYLEQHSVSVQDACNMAIQALSQEPCSDVVSRDAAIEAVKQAIYNHDSAIMRLTELPSVTQKSTECEDAISRDWLKTAIHNFYYGLKHTPTEEDIQAYIDAAPSVTQKSGKWIEHPEIETSAPEYLMFYECSECGDKQCFCKSDIHKKRFCNNCGAKMERGEKE